MRGDRFAIQRAAALWVRIVIPAWAYTKPALFMPSCKDEKQGSCQ
jgi:hypothetical protein